ncbi:YdeI/OmpD-associated family protein [Winogradskyella eckloniae]|uniref:YdeI/OmpD-associated family protein n=1 Tax=Winogradskyella eckloniae TaxID=1089306 RepID=UPI001564C259|nr:YdeI/OmpD-associated family protein [Winogradskyella eckloniae]NRD20449.1 YdeI/OmpD-associated family protein [Winogradskyella eckloniae]
MTKISSVEEYIELNTHYAEALRVLRNIILKTELTETIKWSMPTYCLNGKNVLGIGAFKNHFCLWFHQGVFLKDELQLLQNAQDGKTKAMRQMRFNSKVAINEVAVLAYIKEAIENQRIGKELKPQRQTQPIVIPEVLKTAFKSNAKLKAAFNTFSPSHQREYCNYIIEAKRQDTKQRRLEKIIPMIIKGNGLHDKYKNR